MSNALMTMKSERHEDDKITGERRDSMYYLTLGVPARY